MVVRRADGTEIPVEASISEVLGSWGRLFTVILRDVSARQRAEQALAERLRLEQLVTHLAMTFGHLSTVELDLEVQRGLRAVVDFLEVDRGSLIEFSRAGEVARCWAIEDWMDVDDFPWMAARLQRGEFVTVSRLEELPDDAPSGSAELSHVPRQATGSACRWKRAGESWEGWCSARSVTIARRLTT